MAETGAGGPPYRQGLDVPKFKKDRALAQVNKPQNKSLASRIRNLVLGGTIAVTAGAGADAALGDPVGLGNLVNQGQTVAEDHIKNVQTIAEGAQDWVDESRVIDRQTQHYLNVLNKTEQPVIGEELIDRQMKIVAAGATEEEKQEMIRNNTPVNVRNWPGTYTDTGQLTETLGSVPQGAVAEKVVRVPGTAPRSPEQADWFFGSWTFTAPEGETKIVTGVVYNIYASPVDQDPSHW